MEGTIGIEEGEEYNKNEWGRKGSGVLHPRGNLCPAPGGEEASCMGGDAVGEKTGSGLLSGGHRPDPRPAECTYRARDEPVHEEGREAAAYPAVDEDKNLQSTYPIPNG